MATTFRNIAAPYWAEFVGTLVLTTVGLGASAQNLTSESAGKTDALNSSVAWGLAVALGIWSSEHVSGGHINPAVTIAHLLFRNFPFSQVVGYLVSQTLGAFAGAFLVWWNYSAALGGLKHDEPGLHPATGAFITANDVAQGLSGEILASFVFVLAYFAINDQNSSAKNIAPLATGLALTGVSLGLSSPLSLAINPARDLGPRIFTAFAYGLDVFSDNSFYFWVPVVGPIVGAALGAFVYDWLVRTDAQYHALEEGTA
ncbi:glycerol channel [Dipsacomyces acuminosporus]|nr:glycerol channel [Dipsacomyces acuminosporus]